MRSYLHTLLSRVLRPVYSGGKWLVRTWPLSGLIVGSLWALLGFAVDPEIIVHRLFTLFPVIDQCPEWLAPVIFAPIICFQFGVMFGVPLGILLILVSAGCFWRSLVLRLPPHMRIPSSALVVVLVVGAFIWRGHAVPQGFCGSVVRWFNGESGVMQAANDMADDLRTDPDLANLQPWAVETLARFQQGQVLTNAPPDYMSNWQRVPPRLAASEVPDFLTRPWSGTNGMGETEPIVTIPASDETRPAYLVIDWRCYSIVVGPPEFVMPGQYSNSYVKAKPGIYVSAHFR